MVAALALPIAILNPLFLPDFLRDFVTSCLVFILYCRNGLLARSWPMVVKGPWPG